MVYSWLDEIPEAYLKKFAAYYLNEAQKLDKEVVIVRKQNDLPTTFSVDDLEKSRKNKIDEKVWMTDETVSYGSWYYTENLTIKPTKDVLHVLIDTTSKNGIQVLNVSPMANGTMPDDQRKVLLRMGAWLDKYGESIYGTRPWYTFGEGPTKEPEGHFHNHQKFEKIVYSTEDIRSVTKNEHIYATLLGKPKAVSEILFTAFAKDSHPSELKITNVSLLGEDGKLDYTYTDEGLKIRMPELRLDEMAVVIKITKEYYFR